jgi:BlaI family transcriptional regulator, penicillinase repressor
MMLEKQHFGRALSISICSFSSISYLAAVKRFENGQLTRRERQVMEILFRKGRCTAEEVMEEIPDPPSYSAVRALLATLEQKELVSHSKDSRRYVYEPTVPEKKAKRTALKQLMATFFEGSPEKLVAALLDPKDQELSKSEIAKIRKLIDGGAEK